MIEYYEKCNRNKMCRVWTISTTNIYILICTFNYMMNRINKYVFTFSAFQRSSE